MDIEKIIKSNEFQETIEYYQQIFDILKHLMKDEYSKYVYTIISEYLIMLVRLSIISFNKNNFIRFIEYLEDFIIEIKNNKIFKNKRK